MIGYIYQIENLVNHKSYIGQSIDFKRRKQVHINKLRKNKHDNPKLQQAWNKYGEQEFHFRVWVFNISSSSELDSLECEYIKKYNSIEEGYNLIEGGTKPPSRQKINNEDVVKFLCVLNKYGDGYGKTFEQIFDWSRGTASKIKLRQRFISSIEIFDNLTDQEKETIAIKTYVDYNLEESRIKRQLLQGGSEKSYTLTQDDFNLAFTAQELGFKYGETARRMGLKENTVKDWFNGRSRKKEKQIFNKLSENEKLLLRQAVYKWRN